MRRLILIAALPLAVAACSKTSEDEGSEDFRPPTAQTRADYQTSLDRRFARMDRNSDGAIQAEEMRGRRRQQGSDSASGPGASGLGASGGAGARGGGRAALVKALDSDGDGEVTRGEFTSGSLARFDKADADRDGTLTSAEREASGLFGGGRRNRDAQPATGGNTTG